MVSINNTELELPNMKNKWQASQVRTAQKWLIETWPELFTPGRDLKPLGLKVHKQILQHPDRPAGASRRAVTEALKRHTRSFGYLFGMTRHTHRVGLDMTPLEAISDEHRQWAHRTLRRFQKLAQASRRKGPRAQQITRKVARARPSVNKAPTQITYKKNRRRLVLKPVVHPTPANSDIAAA